MVKGIVMSKIGKSLIKQAEQNILNHAMFIQDMMTIIDSMAYQVNSFAHEYAGRSDIQEGLHMVRIGLYKELMYANDKALAFVGVGGKEALEYSKARAKKIFGEKHSVMELLDKHLRIPSSWFSDDEEQLKTELKEVLEND